MTTRDPLNIVGSTIAEKYRIERLVGEGGFAVVYRAQHTIWNQPVAIKFFNGLSSAPVDQREEFKNQFIQEGALLTELSSQTASIVQARDVGEYTSPYGQWMPYMVLEWLDGVALDELLERERTLGTGPWNIEQVVTLLAQVANALDVAHGKGIAHRDIKPANIFVLGEQPRLSATLKVLDFGVAKMMSDNTQLKAAMAKTGMNITSFTPQYGAPEQFSRSYGATGPWTDVYALALVAVEMLIGKPALDGDDIVQLAFATGNTERRPTPRNLGVQVSDAVESVFAKALAINPHDRYARAREFWGELEQAYGGFYNQGGYRSSLTSAEFGTRPTHLIQGSTVRQPATQANIASTSSPATLNASSNARAARPACSSAPPWACSAWGWSASCCSAASTRRASKTGSGTLASATASAASAAVRVRRAAAQLSRRNGANPRRPILHGLGSEGRTGQRKALAQRDRRVRVYGLCTKSAPRNTRPARTKASVAALQRRWNGRRLLPPSARPIRRCAPFPIPKSSITRSPASPGRWPTTTARPTTSGCPPKRSGSLPRAVRMVVSTLGVMIRRPRNT